MPIRMSRDLRSVWMRAARWPRSPTHRPSAPNFSITEVIGILREKVYSTIAQPFTPQQMSINTFGSTFFPGITIVDPLNLGNPAR